MKLTLLGSVMAFGLAPQVVAQDSTIVFADADTYEVVLDQPITFELDEAKFESLRDLGVTLVPDAANGPAVPEGQVITSPQPPTVLSFPGAQPVQPQISAPATMPGNMMDIPIKALPSIANLVDRVSPSVVNIIVTTDTGETTSEGQGSGFIISDKLEIVTNYHVIEGGTNIDIEFNDGRTYPAKILGTDEETDLALLQLQTDEKMG